MCHAYSQNNKYFTDSGNFLLTETEVSEILNVTTRPFIQNDKEEKMVTTARVHVLVKAGVGGSTPSFQPQPPLATWMMPLSGLKCFGIHVIGRALFRVPRP